MLSRTNTLFLILAACIVAATAFMAVKLAGFGESPLFVVVGPALIPAILASALVARSGLGDGQGGGNCISARGQPMHCRLILHHAMPCPMTKA